MNVSISPGVSHTGSRGWSSFLIWCCSVNHQHRIATAKGIRRGLLCLRIVDPSAVHHVLVLINSWRQRQFLDPLARSGCEHWGGLRMPVVESPRDVNRFCLVVVKFETHGDRSFRSRSVQIGFHGKCSYLPVQSQLSWPAFVFRMTTTSCEDDSGKIGSGSELGCQARRMRHREMSHPRTGV